jgi:hypothetical protein
MTQKHLVQDLSQVVQDLACNEPVAGKVLDQFAIPSTIEAQVKDLQAQLKQLQVRVVGKGVQITNKTFQSFVDVKVWVSIYLPNHRHGLFVDGVSIFEFFMHGHIEAEMTYSSFYNQHRTGFQ